jgi:nicotinate-nucleotide adenylyltransferase
MKIGLFFGSFNPVHVGHLIIAGYMADFTELDQVWLVVSPQSPLKKRSALAGVYDRIEMVRLAVEEHDRLRVSDIEISLPQPSYTIDTLAYLKERFPEHIFSLIMGADNVVSLTRWKNHEILLREHRIFVYPRPGFDLSAWNDHPALIFTDTPLLELSSTFIRKALKDKKDIRYMLTAPVLDFIEKKSLYSR